MCKSKMLKIYVGFIIYVEVECVTKKAPITIKNKMGTYGLKNLTFLKWQKFLEGKLR